MTAAKRTTVALIPEAYQIARAVAREQDISMGQAISNLILRPITADPGCNDQIIGGDRKGFPQFLCDRTVTSADVKQMEDDELKKN